MQPILAKSRLKFFHRAAFRLRWVRGAAWLDASPRASNASRHHKLRVRAKDGTLKICCVCGARPKFMKLSAVTRALDAHGAFERMIVQTGQHYDRNMYEVMFVDLGLPRPDINLEVA